MNSKPSLLSLNFQSWTPDHEQDSFSKNLLDHFNLKMDQDFHTNHAMNRSDLNMSETTFEDEDEDDDDERNYSSIASSQHLNDINRSSTTSGSYTIREHEIPSTSAAAVVAAAKAASKRSSIDCDSSCSSASIQQPQPQKNRNILKKSSIYFSEKIMKKKSTMFPKTPATPNTSDKLKNSLDQKRRSSPGITIKAPSIPQPSDDIKPNPWWRRLKYFSRDRLY